MLGSLLGDFVPYIVGALGLVAAFFGYTRKVRKDTERIVRSGIEADAVEEYAKDRKEIDNAKPVDTDAGNARDRLRDRQANRYR